MRDRPTEPGSNAGGWLGLTLGLWAAWEILPRAMLADLGLWVISVPGELWRFALHSPWTELL